MKRGDIVTVALAGAYGKPRPALIIQSDAYGEAPSITVLPITSYDLDTGFLRVPVLPGAETGLVKSSQIMTDKIMTLPRTKVGQRIGALDAEKMRDVERALALFLALP